MTTTLSSKGQIVLPKLARSKLQLTTGTKFICEVQGDSLVLRPQHPKTRRSEHVIDPVSGLRVTKQTSSKATVTSETVKALMAEFP